MTAWPGQMFSVMLSGIDEFGHPTTGSVRFTPASSLVSVASIFVTLHAHGFSSTYLRESVSL